MVLAQQLIDASKDGGAAFIALTVFCVLFMASLVGTFLPVPIGFDVAVAGALLNGGLAPGYVMALVFTLGIFSIYSFFIVAGAISIPVVVQMMREALRQVYYGGVLVDTRTQPVSVKSDPSIPGNMVFVIDAEGKTTRYTSDQLSPELLLSVFKAQ